MARYRGRVAMAGFLGGGAPLSFDPLLQLPSGVQFSFFASAFMFGGPDLLSRSKASRRRAATARRSAATASSQRARNATTATESALDGCGSACRNWIVR
jgi:hypothetical protein